MGPEGAHHEEGALGMLCRRGMLTRGSTRGEMVREGETAERSCDEDVFSDAGGGTRGSDLDNTEKVPWRDCVTAGKSRKSPGQVPDPCLALSRSHQRSDGRQAGVGGWQTRLRHADAEPALGSVGGRWFHQSEAQGDLGRN